MTVLMFQTRFVEPILAHVKSARRIRPPRKRPIEVGEPLSLRHWHGKAYRSPQVEFARATCSGGFPVWISDAGIQLGYVPQKPAELNRFARDDGFANWPEMREFVRSTFGYGLPFRGVLILWEAAHG